MAAARLATNLSLVVDLTAVNEATFTWSGQLPPRNNKDPLYSCKVFLGGVPWDITEGRCPLYVKGPRFKHAYWPLTLCVLAGPLSVVQADLTKVKHCDCSQMLTAAGRSSDTIAKAEIH